MWSLQKVYLLKIAGNLFNLLVVINCSVNFVLYSSFSSKFRMTFRRLFCHRVRRCRCLGGDASELRWLRDDEDGIEMTCSKVDGTTVAARGDTSSAQLVGGRRQRRGETVIVVATPGGGRAFVKRQRSRDRKDLAPTTTVEMTVTSRCGLTTTTTTPLMTPGGSHSSISDISVPLVASQPTDIVLESA